MKIHTFDTPKETARAVTHQLLKQLDTVRKDAFNLAISGGHTSELLFHLWAEIYPQSLPWQRVHLYWVDERCVPPTDGDSNYGLAKRTFLNHVKIPHDQIHRILGEANPDHEAQRYSDLVKKNLPDNDGFPQFDLLILGIGTDGHTSSIFPEQKDLLNYPTPYAVSVHPETQILNTTLFIPGSNTNIIKITYNRDGMASRISTSRMNRRSVFPPVYPAIPP